MSFYEFPHTRTYDSDLGWLIKKMKEILLVVDEMEEWKTQHQGEYNELKSLYDAIMSGNFPSSVITAFNKWASVNMPSLIKQMIKMVWFGLTDDGYFVAYIPDSWADIIFNTTGLDISLPDYDYGHLVLSFNV